MNCPICKKQGKQSVVQEGVTMTQLAYVPPFYENTVYHHHDTNKKTTDFECSNGHSFTWRRYAKCPACDFKNGSDELLEGHHGFGS